MHDTWSEWMAKGAVMQRWLALQGVLVGRHWLLRYGLAVVTAVVAMALRLMIEAWLPPGFPFIVVFPTLLVVTYVAGRGPGALCMALGGLIGWYCLLEPVNSFALTPRTAVALGFYLFTAGSTIMLIDQLLVRQRQLQASEARMAEMAATKVLLYRELQHRVANNLGSLASMLRLERRRIERDPAQALAAIDRADERITLLGHVHRLLHDPAARSAPLDQQVANVVAAVRHVVGGERVTVRIVMRDVRFEGDRLLTLMLLITELVTNSFKHAWPPEMPGVLSITLAETAPGWLRLTVADDGCGDGRSDEVDTPGSSNSEGLGRAIIGGLAAQLGGRIEPATAQDAALPGTTTVVALPLRR